MAMKNVPATAGNSKKSRETPRSAMKWQCVGRSIFTADGWMAERLVAIAYAIRDTPKPAPRTGRKGRSAVPGATGSRSRSLERLARTSPSSDARPGSGRIDLGAELG